MKGGHSVRVLCIDPGGRTGYCIAEGTSIHEVGVATSLKEVYELLQDSEADTIVIEQFNRGQQVTDDHIYTIKVIGVGALFVALHPNVALVYQTPYERKAFVEKAKQYVSKLECKSVERPHITDAVAHWLAFQNKQRGRK